MKGHDLVRSTKNADRRERRGHGERKKIILTHSPEDTEQEIRDKKAESELGKRKLKWKVRVK